MSRLKFTGACALAGVASLISSCGQALKGTQAQTSHTAEAWDSRNNPFNLSSRMQRNFNALPQGGRARNQPWSDTYWPSSHGGIASRWYTNRPDGFSYAPLAYRDITRLSSQQLASLSPAEKYDIFMGDYSYPTVVSERRRVSPNDASWEGLCHGWAPASVHFFEPRPVVVVGANGVRVPFGASDIKALLTYYEGVIASSSARMIGARCEVKFSRNPQAALNSECRDVNAGAFHIALANYIGLSAAPVIGDITRDSEVWNQPIHSYRSQVVGQQGPSAGAAPGTVRELVVNTQISYSSEVAPNWYPTNGTRGHSDGTKSYQYRLELDGAGQIIGGEWLTQDRPDFVWVSERPLFGGYYAGILNLYNASVSGVAPVPPSPPAANPSPNPAPRNPQLGHQAAYALCRTIWRDTAYDSCMDLATSVAYFDAAAVNACGRVGTSNNKIQCLSAVANKAYSPLEVRECNRFILFGRIINCLAGSGSPTR